MKKITLFLFLICSIQFVFGQSLKELSPVEQKVERLEQSGADFSSVTLFNASAADLSQKSELSGILVDGTLLQVDPAQVSAILKEQPVNISLTLPRHEKSDLVLDLYMSDIFAPGFSVTTDVSNGQPVEAETGIHYHGVVRGEPGYLAAISISEFEIAGLITTENGNLVLGKLKGQNANEHVFYSDADLLVTTDASCETVDNGLPYSPEQLAGADEKDAGDCVQIYIEVNKDIYQDKGSVTTSYVTALFNQSAILYANESIEISISEILIITSGNPYPQNSASQLLSKFQQLRGGGFNGDLGHLISYKGSGGIAAGFNGLCNSNPANSLCFSGIDPTFNNFPTYSWSVMVFTHEMGHLFGSRHTHACVWNGNNTAIDGCYTTEGSCGSPGIPQNGGTIMSYCHLQSVGINFNNGFGPQPGNVIRGSVAASGCLAASCGGGTGNHCTNGVQDEDETGVDCGGADCPACPTCNDGIQNGDEEGVDCGGSCPTACPPVSCDTPTGLFASNIKPKRAQLNWGAVSGANNYTVELRQQGASTWATGTTSNTSITASSLTNGATYEWRVTANCSGGSSDPSGICTFIAGNSGSGACGSNAALISGDELSVYPNPASSILTLEVNLVEAAEKVAVQVMDINGKLMTQGSLVAGTNLMEIDVSGLPSGIYMVRIENGKQTLATRFVKE